MLVGFYKFVKIFFWNILLGEILQVYKLKLAALVIPKYFFKCTSNVSHGNFLICSWVHNVKIETKTTLFDHWSIWRLIPEHWYTNEWHTKMDGFVNAVHACKKKHRNSNHGIQNVKKILKILQKIHFFQIKSISKIASIRRRINFEAIFRFRRHTTNQLFEN